MSITTIGFLVFLGVVYILYYVVPKQWIVLLVASIWFYCVSSSRGFIFILATSLSIYVATLAIYAIDNKSKLYLKENKENLSKDEIKIYKNKTKAKRKAVLLLVLLLDIGFLCYFKYFHFVLEQINRVASLINQQGVQDTFVILVPLGISFYTFQAIGYLLDVYWENVKPQKNYFKLLLFVSFFPQITQGPISKYEVLSVDLFSKHKISYHNFSWGVQRMVWGFFKKMLVADVLSRYVTDVFANYSSYTGISVLIGAFMYSVQIYADFSGYMDIMCGYCETLGIKLTENFERPYFSKSVAEYWRRWHISLGAWFKSYVYYPIGMSSWNRKLAKAVKNKFGKHFANLLPATIALVIVWGATGLWHGASWGYITWGFINGLIIILSMWLEPLFNKWKSVYRINESSTIWKGFQVVRTFILVTLIKVLPEVGTLSDGVGFLKQIFINHDIPYSFSELLPYVDLSTSVYKGLFLLSIFGTLAMIVVSFTQRKQPVRERFNKLPWFFRVTILAVSVALIVTFGIQATWDVGGFMYEQF